MWRLLWFQQVECPAWLTAKITTRISNSLARPSLAEVQRLATCVESLAWLIRIIALLGNAWPRVSAGLGRPMELTSIHLLDLEVVRAFVDAADGKGDLAELPLYASWRRVLASSASAG